MMLCNYTDDSVNECLRRIEILENKQHQCLCDKNNNMISWQVGPSLLNSGLALTPVRTPKCTTTSEYSMVLCSVCGRGLNNNKALKHDNKYICRSCIVNNQVIE